MAKKKKRASSVDAQEEAKRKLELLHTPNDNLSEEEIEEKKEIRRKNRERRRENAHLPLQPVERLMRVASGGFRLSKEAAQVLVTHLEEIITKVVQTARSDSEYSGRQTIQERDILRAINKGAV